MGSIGLPPFFCLFVFSNLVTPSCPSLLLTHTPLPVSRLSLSPPGSVLWLGAWRGAAVQEERQRIREREEGLECSSAVNEEMPVEKILEAETSVEQRAELHSDAGSAGSSPHDAVTNICQTADKQLFALVEWAKRIPHFSELPLDDQVILLRAGTTV
uniref:NR LBD domain-containing protein n=1 Tax=Hucho hucho TaxID=62062 RepID=A0A4W5LUC5_9TELE